MHDALVMNSFEHLILSMIPLLHFRIKRYWRSVALSGNRTFASRSEKSDAVVSRKYILQRRSKNVEIFVKNIEGRSQVLTYFHREISVM